MKQLQNAYTTIEQSKRLLKLGVPADSSDFHYTIFATILWHHEPGVIDFSNSDAIPIWSVGRLIEIWLLCSSEYDDFGEPPGILLGKCNLAEYMTHTIETCRKSLDFSKLED